jgi:Cys-tRNA(Pro)/Cys-tRNA(Cys) deacylase
MSRVQNPPYREVLPVTAYDRVLQLLTAAAVPFQVAEHVPVVRVEEALVLVPELCLQLLKTLVFRLADGGWVLAAVEAPKRVHYRLLAQALGVNRTGLRAVAPDELERGTGFPLGGVGPFPIQADIRVLLDQAVLGLDWVHCGSGRNDRTLRLATADLVRVSGALVRPLVREQT